MPMVESRRARRQAFSMALRPSLVCAGRTDRAGTDVDRALGVLVCADGRLPTIARALVDARGRIFVMPTAWVTSGRDPHSLENVQADLLARCARTRTGSVCCRQQMRRASSDGRLLRKEPNRRCTREIVAIASQRDAQTLYATMDLGEPRHRNAAAFRSPPAPRGASIGACDSRSRSSRLPSDIEGRLEVLDETYALSPHDGAARAPDRYGSGRCMGGRRSSFSTPVV